MLTTSIFVTVIMNVLPHFGLRKVEANFRAPKSEKCFKCTEKTTETLATQAIFYSDDLFVTCVNCNFL